MKNRSRFTIPILLALCSAASTLPAAELTSDQRTQLLQEATAAYKQGLQSSSSDVAAAKDAFTSSADKYRLLIDSGIENPRLYENLGNASLQSGRLGAAIAAYEHAAVLAPSDGSIRRHLEHAEAIRDGGASTAETSNVRDMLARWNGMVSLNSRMVIGLLAWTSVWVGLIGWLVTRRHSWRQTAVGAGVVTLLTAASIGWSWSRMPHTEFGIVTTPAIVRTHNGETFPPVFEQPASEGTRFDVLDRRGEWLHIRLADGTDGWIPRERADVIVPATSPWG